MEKNIVVFAPHPGDETWGCGGTIAKRISEGYNVSVVVMTDGRYAFLKTLGIDSDPTPGEVKEMRIDDVRRATSRLGVSRQNIFLLNFEDGTLERKVTEAREKVVELLSRASPVEVYYTYQRDYHADHRATNSIVRNSFWDLGLHTVKYQYSIARSRVSIGSLIDTVFSPIRHNVVHVDISKFLSLKKLAIEELRSEVTIVSSKQEKPLTERIEKYLRNEETFFLDK